MRIITIVCLILINLLDLQAQEDGSRSDHHKKIEELKAVKLLEILNTDEKTGLSVIAKMKEFNLEVGPLFQQKDSLIWNYKKNLPANEKEAKNRVTKIISFESKIAAKRSEYLASLKQILTDEELLRYFLFEKEFRKELKEMLKRKRED